MFGMFGKCRNTASTVFHSQVRYCSMSNDLVLMEPWSASKESITKITMNNPKKRNCLSSEMMRALISNIQAANSQSSTQVIVLNGNGPILSAGHDLKELLAASKDGDQSKLQQVAFSMIRNEHRVKSIPHEMSITDH